MNRAERGALDGIVVLEFGMVMQVPLAAQMLGDFGAEVIKIERPAGDIMRYLDDRVEETDGIGTYYTAVGRNKRLVGLDVKSDEGKKAIFRLIDRADVVIHNFRPGVMDKLGLGYEELQKRNPRLIYAVGYGFGETGPIAELPGQDLLAQSYSGLALSGADEDDAPGFSNSPIVDYTTAVTLTQAIMAALIERQRSGKGQLVTTSLLDVALSLQMTEIAGWSVRGVRSNWVRQSMVFQAADGWIMVLTLFRDNPLQLLCRAFGIEDASVKEEYNTKTKQVERLSEIREMFAPLFRDLSQASCMERLRKVDILFSPVNNVQTCIESEQIAINGSVWEVEISKSRTVKVAGTPVRMSRTPLGVKHQPAAVGAHTDEILAELGFSEDDISRMRQSGAAY